MKVPSNTGMQKIQVLPAGWQRIPFKKIFIRVLIVLSFFSSFYLLGCKYYFVREDATFQSQLKPGSPEYYNFIAQVYYSREKYNRAIFFYNKIIERYADSENSSHRLHVAWAYYEIGFCHRKRARWAKAFEFFNLALETSNDYVVNTLALDQLERLEQRKKTNSKQENKES